MSLEKKRFGKAGALWGALAALVFATQAAAQTNAKCPSNPLPSGYDWTNVKTALENSPFQRGGLIVYHKGEVVYWTGFGWWDGQSCDYFINNHNFNVASLSKTFTAAMAMAVAQDPNVNFSLNDLVKDHITNATSLNASQFDDNGTGRLVYDHMTIDDLITMMTGQETVSAWPVGLTSCINNPFVSFEACGEDMIAADIAEDDDPNNNSAYVYAPGEAFSYGPMSWQILGLAMVKAIEAVDPSNADFTTILEDYLTGPCNLTDTIVKRPNNEWAAGGFETDLFDGGAFAQALLSGECGNNHTLFNAASLTALNEVTVPLQSGSVPTVSSPIKDLDLDYARGQWVFDQGGSKIYLGVGAWGAVTFYSPDKDWAAYLHLDDHLLTGYIDATNLIIEPGGLADLIDIQANNNP